MLGVIKLHRNAVEDIHPSATLPISKTRRALLDARLGARAEIGISQCPGHSAGADGDHRVFDGLRHDRVEPDIALVKYKLLAGGGMLKMVNRGVSDALRRLGYGDQTRVGILAHVEKFDTIEDVEENGQTVSSGLKAAHLPVFDCAFRAHRGKRSISYMAHLKMMGAAQHSSAAPFPKRSTCRTSARWKTSRTPTCRPGKWV